jgi:hypothetical protein
MQMLGTLDAKGTRKDIIPRRRGAKTIVGKSVDELIAELAAPMQ